MVYRSFAFYLSLQTFPPYHRIYRAFFITDLFCHLKKIELYYFSQSKHFCCKIPLINAVRRAR